MGKSLTAERGDALRLDYTCQHEAAHHSADIFEVYTGAAEPRVLCGYHAMREGWTA